MREHMDHTAAVIPSASLLQRAAVAVHRDACYDLTGPPGWSIWTPARHHHHAYVIPSHVKSSLPKPHGSVTSHTWLDPSVEIIQMQRAEASTLTTPSPKVLGPLQVAAFLIASIGRDLEMGFG